MGVRITFPHLGSAYIPLEEMINGVGHDPVVPPPNNKSTLELGSRLSPEDVCLPFKIILGNMLQGIEAGAESVLMIGGCGPCRLGYYGEAQKVLLRKAGLDVGFLSLEPLGKLEGGTISFLRRVFGPTNPARLVNAARLAWAKLAVVEWLEVLALSTRPMEATKGTSTQVLNQWLNAVRAAQTMGRLREVCRLAADQFEAISKEKDGETHLRIGLVGEIYTVVEPFANRNIEEHLGNLGVEVVRTISLKRWMEDHVFKRLLGLSYVKELQKWAEGYLSGSVGGHGLESVARSIRLARFGLDAVIHILPLACMPEVIAQGILPKVSVDTGTPIMSLVVDEHSSEVGTATRLEAFVDLVERRHYASV